MKRLFNKDVPFITYIIHDKNMKNGRTVTVYKPTQEYYILFELIKFRRLPSTFPDIGITVISEGLEPSPSDVSVTQDVTTPELAARDALIERLIEAGNVLVDRTTWTTAQSWQPKMNGVSSSPNGKR